jgi:membrane protease YdiL (CAAX protease family)
MLVPTILLLAVEALRPRSLLRQSFTIRSRSFAYGFIVALVASVILNWTNTWPFTWRWASSTTGAYAQLLLHRHQAPAMVVWAVTSIAILPVLEEAIFRVGLLRVLSHSTRSSRFAIVASSLVFGAAHLGSPFWAPDVALFVNAFWVFVGALIIADTTVRDAWNVSIALGSHVARNAIEFTLLLLAVSSASR